MVERVEKVVYVTEGGQEFKDYNEAHKAEAIERLTTMLYELRNCDDYPMMAEAMLKRRQELGGIIAQYQDEGE